jgi:Tol biopolymer transport system component
VTDERWRLTYSIYEAAARLAEPERQQYVLATAPDAEVASKVVAMLDDLEATAPVEDFDEPISFPNPAPDPAPRLPNGTRIGRFTLTGFVGEGGMGRVYSANDPDLNREVALKVIAREADASGSERFIREAQAASALNHPNIVTVYEVIRSGPLLAIVMELVAGTSLRPLCGTPQPVGTLARWGGQIAHALSAAHAQGIVHRDIKPENLMLRPDGYIKVLDFGLARQADAGRAADELPLGTLGYMSPEEIRQQPISAASDIFSLGVVLYELASGTNPFRSDSASATTRLIQGLAAPPLPMPGGTFPLLRSSRKTGRVPRRQSREFPAGWRRGTAPFALKLDRLVHSMLSKSAADRPTAFEVALQLDDMPEPRASWRRIALVVSALALAVLALEAGAVWWTGSGSQKLAFETTPLTTLAGSEEGPSFSPDGNQVAYRGNQNNQWDIYTKPVEGERPLRLTSDAGVHWYPAWSPDGKWIAFMARHSNGRNGLFLMPALGGPERLLAGFEGDWQSADWSPDAKWIAVGLGVGNYDLASGVTLISLQTGERRELVRQQPEMVQGAFGRFSPDGKRLAFLKMRGAFGQLYIADLTDDMRLAGKPQQILPGSTDAQYPAWTADGKEIVFMRGFASSNGSLTRVSVNGGAARKIPGLGYTAGPIGIARNGGRLAFSRGGIDADIWRLDTTGKETPRKWIASTAHDVAGEYSPDGNRICFSSNRSGPRELWISDADGGNAMQLTHFGGPITGSPHWSPDGRWIAFDSRPRGSPDAFVIASDGSRPRRLTEKPDEDIRADGKRIYFTSDRTGHFEIWSMPWEGGPAVQVTKHGGTSAYPGRDSEWIYYVNGGPGFLRRIKPDGSGDAVVVDRPVTNTHYTAIHGSTYFVVSSGQKNQLQRLRPDGRATTILELPFNPGLGLSLTPDGRYVLVTKPDENGTDLMLVEGFR